MRKKRYLKCSSELADGYHSQIIPMDLQIFSGIVEGWFSCKDDWPVGDGFSVEIVELTDKQFAELPEM